MAVVVVTPSAAETGNRPPRAEGGARKPQEALARKRSRRRSTITALVGPSGSDKSTLPAPRGTICRLSS